MIPSAMFPPAFRCPRLHVLPLFAALACDQGHAAPVAPSAPEPARREGRHEPERASLLHFEGACDASGAVPLDERRFAVADDEDNVLRVYDGERGGPPLQQFDVSPELDLARRKKPESDIEAATRLGNEGYFLTSHGRTRKGKRDPDRFLFFATTLPAESAAISVVGQPYRTLVDDLAGDPRFARFDLESASRRAPKDPGGMNLEGMTAGPDGTFLLGFRSPIPGQHALLVRLHNPRQMMHGERPSLSEPVLLDLGGLGVRAISFWRGKYLIAAGPSGEGGPFRLYRWDGSGAASAVERAEFSSLNPEGFFTPETRNQVLVLSDDGSRQIEGKPCKKLKDPSKKRFRGAWLALP